MKRKKLDEWKGDECYEPWLNERRTGKAEDCKQLADTLQSLRPTSATLAALGLLNFRKPNRCSRAIERRNNIVEGRLNISMGWPGTREHARLTRVPSGGIYSSAIAGSILNRRYYGIDAV